MNYKLLMDMAVKSGEILLNSGAEIYRVEETMNHILKTSSLKTTEAFVIATGFVITLDDPSIEAMTVVKRVNNRSTNLNRVCIVNDLSRKLCSGLITLEDAYEQLCMKTADQQYPRLVHHLGTIGTAALFTIILGGDLADVLFAAIAGAVLTSALTGADYINLNGFCKNALGSFAIAFVIMLMNRLSHGAFDTDIVMIGSIMPIVPGVIFTTAIRDTLYGDYLSGCSRIMEAIIIALGVAAGTGAGIALFRYLI